MQLPKIRESIDVYIAEDQADLVALFYFLNTRRELRLRVNEVVKELLPLLDGSRSLPQLIVDLNVRCEGNVEEQDVRRFLAYLEEKSILTDAAYAPPAEWFCEAELARYERQISFWGDFCQSADAKFSTQKRLKDATVVILGCGAVGGWIAVELAMLGIGHLILLDDDQLDRADIARHPFMANTTSNLKVHALGEELVQVNHYTRVTTLPLRLGPDTNLEPICSGASLVVNCADEPYIGFTALKVSEYCVPRGIPHYIGGGFDAHLASTGELVVPGETPCAFCYADFFTAALKDWNPSEHPVPDRLSGMGGLSCLSIFSASYAVTDLVKVLTGLPLGGGNSGRGEFIFDTMDIAFIEVDRNPACRLCGGGRP